MYYVNSFIFKTGSIYKLRKHLYKLVRKYRWEKGLRCPKCKSINVKKNGKYHYNKHIQRYYCKDCKKSFSDTTNTIFHNRKVSIEIVIYMIFQTIIYGQSIRDVHLFLGISYKSLYKLTMEALKFISIHLRSGSDKLEGEIEVDEFFVKSGLKGRGYSELIRQRRMPRKRGLRLRGRGTFEKDLIGVFSY